MAIRDKEKNPFTANEVVAVLASHDAVRGDDRDAFKAYLADAFNTIAELNNRVGALEKAAAPKQ